MNLPPFVYAKAFWEALSLAAGGALALLAFFGVVDPSWAVPTTVIATWIFALLRMFGIVPELRLRALQVRYESLLEAHRDLLAEFKGVKMAQRKTKI